MEVKKRTGSHDASIDYWLANPEATEHEGKPIAQFTKVYSAARAALKDNLKKLLEEDNDLGIIVSHATSVELPVIALISTETHSPVKSLNEIRGSFDMEEFARLTINQESMKAILKYKCLNYPININKL